MIKVKALEEFTLKEFGKLKNIERVRYEKEGRLYKGDVFECDEEMAKYLLGENLLGKAVVEVIEVAPEKEAESSIEEEPKVVIKEVAVEVKKNKKKNKKKSK